LPSSLSSVVDAHHQTGVNAPDRSVDGCSVGSIIAGIWLTGIGLLISTGWWWAGIMVVIGVPVAAGLLPRGQLLPALGVVARSRAIPLTIPLASAVNVPWKRIAGFLLIALGGSVILRRVLQCS
jgi:hypothetical protein